jgi:hypothetical protein
MSRQNVTVKINERQKQILDIVKENPNILQTELANPPPTKKISIKRFYLLTIGIFEAIFSAQVYRTRVQDLQFQACLRAGA